MNSYESVIGLIEGNQQSGNLKCDEYIKLDSAVLLCSTFDDESFIVSDDGHFHYDLKANSIQSPYKI